MKTQELSFAILTTGGDSGPTYRGQIVCDDGRNAIMAHYDCATDYYDDDASRYFLIEEQHRKNVAFYDDLDDFNLACHQNHYCMCSECISPCPAKGKGPYTGPTFTSDEIYSVCYLDLYDDEHDHENDPDGSVPVHSPYISVAYQRLRENPSQVQRCMDAIRAAGDGHAHGARRQIVNQKYVGKRFFHFNTFHSVVDHLEVLKYNADHDEYVCLVLKADLSGTGRTCWVEGHEARSACDGHAQDKLRQIKAAIQHLNKPDSASGTDHLNTL